MGHCFLLMKNIFHIFQFDIVFILLKLRSKKKNVYNHIKYMQILSYLHDWNINAMLNDITYCCWPCRFATVMWIKYRKRQEFFLLLKLQRKTLFWVSVLQFLLSLTLNRSVLQFHASLYRHRRFCCVTTFMILTNETPLYLNSTFKLYYSILKCL